VSRKLNDVLTFCPKPKKYLNKLYVGTTTSDNWHLKTLSEWRILNSRIFFNLLSSISFSYIYCLIFNYQLSDDVMVGQYSIFMI